MESRILRPGLCRLVIEQQPMNQKVTLWLSVRAQACVFSNKNRVEKNNNNLEARTMELAQLGQQRENRQSLHLPSSPPKMNRALENCGTVTEVLTFTFSSPRREEKDEGLRGIWRHIAETFHFWWNHKPTDSETGQTHQDELTTVSMPTHLIIKLLKIKDN